MEIEKKLLEFSTTVRSLLQKSDMSTKFAIESFDYLDKSVSYHKEKLRTFLTEIDLKILREKNLKMASKELESFLTIVDIIERDKLEIMQGPKGNLIQYIKNMEHANQIENYSWIKEQSSKFANKRVELCYFKFKTLIRHGENILLDEFQNQIRHFSQNENILIFINFLIMKDEDEQKAETLNDARVSDENTKDSVSFYGSGDQIFNMNENTSEVIEMSYEFFMPKETLTNLEAIISWFLQREQQYELYNEKREHCDINQKLKYSEMRSEFLKLCLKRYSKMNSLGFKKDSVGKLKQSMSKIFNQAASKIRFYLIFFTKPIEIYELSYLISFRSLSIIKALYLTIGF
jgi:hypothetical protein